MFSNAPPAVMANMSPGGGACNNTAGTVVSYARFAGLAGTVVSYARFAGLAGTTLGGKAGQTSPRLSARGGKTLVQPPSGGVSPTGSGPQAARDVHSEEEEEEVSRGLWCAPGKVWGSGGGTTRRGCETGKT